MFDKKVTSLMENCSIENKFIKSGLILGSKTLSEEGAVKLSTTGNDFVDQFASISKYKTPRSYYEVDKDMRLLWSQNPLLCLKLSVYIRMITRTPTYISNKNKTKKFSIQKGQGLKNEGIMRIMWIAINYPKVFYKNITLFIAAGSWKDIVTMMNWDLQFNGWNNRVLPWNFLMQTIRAGLICNETTHLVRKYLPTIRSNKKCTTLESQADTLIGRYIAKNLFPKEDKITRYTEYRKLKSKGLAHKWQQQISNQLYNAIDFNTIPGKALHLLVHSKFLNNHNLTDKYSEWISNKKSVKYTGFVFEIFNDINGNTEKHILDTANAQFNKLLQQCNAYSKLLPILDKSGSMASQCIGCNMTAYNVAKAMALYFSSCLTGQFTNVYGEFNNKCELRKWKGETATDKWINAGNNIAYGSTNFESVIDLLIEIKEAGVDESEFPEGILCLSDGEYSDFNHRNETMFKVSINKLKLAGFSDEYVNNFKVILWDIPNYFYSSHPETKYESYANCPNMFHMSGFDASIISFLLEGNINPCNSKELFLSCMNQELLNKLTI
jgi:hypothetical protein